MIELKREDLLSTKDVAEILGVCPYTVRRYIKRGELRAIRLAPKRFLIWRPDLMEFLMAKRGKK